MNHFTPISDADWPETDVELHPFHRGMTADEGRIWARWFNQHGVLTSEGEGFLIWKSSDGGQNGYAMRDIAQRRIGWRDGRTGNHEYLQLESPPLPFPQVAT